ncbi:hypothetical protein [Neobacillus niacini]|uniref:hypothetical protein n=1 Tax=Neobacillus niacini TaxID=86668 RepID=UPI0021CB5B67|nr:hypothetical protein [Neobacillus niacini]MCM3763429.1 hypothetical protein [Neobacillus niacini]
MKKKLGSRKFLVTVAGVITVIANDYFELGLDRESVFSIVSMVAAYVLGQAHVDSKKVSN